MRAKKICKVLDCNLRSRRNGFCSTHSARFLRHGDPLVVKTHRKYFSEEDAKDAHREVRRRYAQTPKGKIVNRIKRQRRRHRGELKADRRLVEAVFAKFQSQCFNCQALEDLTLDHHVPLVKGGQFTLTNLVLLCRACNGKKTDKFAQDFYTPEQLDQLQKLLNQA